MVREGHPLIGRWVLGFACMVRMPSGKMPMHRCCECMCKWLSIVMLFGTYPDRHLAWQPLSSLHEWVKVACAGKCTIYRRQLTGGLSPGSSVKWSLPSLRYNRTRLDIGVFFYTFSTTRQVQSSSNIFERRQTSFFLKQNKTYI